jgi:hypothetical protein
MIAWGTTPAFDWGHQGKPWKNFTKHSWCPNCDSNWKTSEYMPRVTLLCQLTLKKKQNKKNMDNLSLDSVLAVIRNRHMHTYQLAEFSSFGNFWTNIKYLGGMPDIT